MDKQQIGAALSRNVKHTREGLRLSQAAYAEKLNIPRPNLAAIEEGRSMSIENAYKISRYLKVSLDTLLTTDMATGESLEDGGLIQLSTLLVPQKHCAFNVGEVGITAINRSDKPIKITCLLIKKAS